MTSKLSVRRARWAVLAVFFANGAVVASWVPHIPFVKARLELSPSLLGLALLAIAAGALVAMPLAGYLVARVGSRRMTTLATILFCCALPLPLLAPSLPLLALALFLFGAGNGSMDVSMNAQAVAVEKRFRRAIMSSFHAMFSLGGLVGAGVTGTIVALGVSPLAHVLVAAVVLGLLALLALRFFLPRGVDTTSQAPAFALPRRALLGLGLVAFFVLVGEGAMGDWSAVYLANVLGTSPGFAAAGYAAFSLTMALGRFTGDFLVRRFGPLALMRASGLIAGLGLGIGLLLAHPLAAILGFAAVGAGLANTIPILFSAAGRSREMAPGPAIAAVATTGYLGFLVGPVMIGGLADLAGLPLALGLVVLFSLFVAVLAPLVRPG
jgi:predicted MFS family arabinose efflux permease